MSNLHIVTGHAGSNHVTAADMGSFFASILGEGEYVLHRGTQFAIQVVSNNTIRITDGDILMQGRHIRLAVGTHVDLAIDNGSQGLKRNDLICARYTMNSVSGVEECNLVVIKGTATSGTPSDPEYTHGNILNSAAALNDMPLYRIPINGISVGTPVPLFSQIDGIQVHVANRNNPHGITASQIGAAASVHTHDDRYFTETEITSKLAAYMATAGGTFSGQVKFNNKIVLTSNCYGTSLPAAGTAGRIFFKKV